MVESEGGLASSPIPRRTSALGSIGAAVVQSWGAWQGLGIMPTWVCHPGKMSCVMCRSQPHCHASTHEQAHDHALAHVHSLWASSVPNGGPGLFPRCKAAGTQALCYSQEEQFLLPARNRALGLVFPEGRAMRLSGHRRGREREDWGSLGRGSAPPEMLVSLG